MELIVRTNDGRLRGHLRHGVVAFKGVPYAAAPVGRYRFEPPGPVEPWDGIRDASRFRPVVRMPITFRDVAADARLVRAKEVGI
jgi:carboxylesterase type B